MNNRALVVQKVKDTVAKANMIYGINMAVPMIKFDLRGRVAGTANSTTHVLRFNEGLLDRNIEDFLSDTTVHEVAHLVQYVLHPSQRRWTGRKWVRTIQPHGVEWQRVMRSLGAEPSRCHSYDTTETRVKKNVTKYQYKCNCSTHEVGAKVHRKLVLGATYTCRKCKGRLTAGSFVQPVAPVAPAIPMHNPPKRPAEPATKLPKTGSKKERAEALFMQYGTDRELTISMFMQELDMTKAGASTYFYNCSKKLG